jgi:hypothetical protein
LLGEIGRLRFDRIEDSPENLPCLAAPDQRIERFVRKLDGE